MKEGQDLKDQSRVVDNMTYKGCGKGYRKMDNYATI